MRVVTLQILYLEELGCTVWVILACSCTGKFEHCADAPVSIPCEFYRYTVLHQIKNCALIPNSWFRGFCRTRFRTSCAAAGKLEGTVFAEELSE